MMKRFSKFMIPLLAAVFYAAPLAANTNFGNETLKYVITYKWGLITKDSGDATMTLQNHGSNYHIRLTGKTRPWADSFYSVRDTLVSVVDKSSFRPKSYEKLAHESGKYAKDVITYSYSGAKVTGKVKKHREKKGKITESSKLLSATGETYDMLSVFYWLRTIDVDNLIKGKKLRSTLFSGSYAETVTIWKVGEETIKMRDGSKREAWHLRFKFTSKGGKKSSDDIDAWISKDERRVPLHIRATLPIGNVSAYLVSASPSL